MKKTTPELAAIHDRCIVDRIEFEAWLAAREISWQMLSRGEYDFTIEELQLRFVCEDPVKWCAAFMDEPDTGEPYTFFPYQESSIRDWDQDAIHQDGAEVGKTREITAMILWGQCTGFGFTVDNPSILVAAPMQSHLDEIIMAIEMHVGESDGADGRKPIINHFWRKPKKAPHYMMKFKGPTCTKNNIGLVYFRPFGHDGEAMRGVHVNALGLVDEAAKVKNKKCWSEFTRALKPGAYNRFYSVPDGDNKSHFFKIAQKAIKNLEKGKPGFRLFHWPKTLMPDPFWTATRKQEFITRFGGEDSPGYQRNVLGLHGQQENTVWPWELLIANVHNVPEYRRITLTFNNKEEELHLQAQSIELDIHDGTKSPREREITDRHIDTGMFQDPQTRRKAMYDLLREFIEPVAHDVMWAGADLGQLLDPTEITVSREIGKELRTVIRIKAKGMEYHCNAN